MDYMDRPVGVGLDDALFDQKDTDAENVIAFEEIAKPKRAPYVIWTVAGNDYKLRLTASIVNRLEQSFRKNLLIALTDDDLPPLSNMLTTIHGALQAYHHGMTYQKVLDLFDKYVDEGGDQMQLLANVIMPLLSVSGFFTQNQLDILTDQLKDLDIDI